jgi:hypothetical protein
MWHVCERGDVHTGFSWGNLMETDHLEDLAGEGRIIIDLQEVVGEAWTGLICLRIEIGGRRL